MVNCSIKIVSMFIKKFFVVILWVLIIFYACNQDNSNIYVDDFDHEAQALIDNDSLIDFFETHYYDDLLDSIQPIVSEGMSLINDPRLLIQNVTENEVDYKLYVFIKSEGNPNPDKGYPSVVDSVLVKYKGKYFNTTDDLINFEDRSFSPIWLRLNTVIRGWSHGFTNFKGGENVTDNGPITYINGGKGVLFIPSGLGYRNFGTPTIPPNASLMFYIELFDIVENTDHDNDSIPSILEDPDGDGDPRNDDTDSDNIPNYLDQDDDNDGVLTRNEGGDDGDPTNDFSDPENPTLPNYLNPDITDN